MKYEVLTLGAYQTNCSLCWDEETKRCAIIDPGYQPETIVRAMQDRGLTAAMILLTHGHFDHVGAVRPLAQALNIPVYLCEKELDLPEGITGGPLYTTAEYADGDEVKLDGLTFRVLETPGHTPGSVCLLCGDVMFSGDTLFARSCGRTDLPGGSWTQIRESLQKLASLPENYTVIPGHGPATTLDFERRTNPYMTRFYE
ncbi:MAG: MBL fold metallo-hydrolase [Oscillospiraceae bacterium]|nr:MBL fold metallo-hydrolase [Oscillospiraceae bacterium]